MDGTIFFYLGGALVLAALGLSYVGIKGKDSFPPSGRALAGVIAAFALLVGGTAAYAVANARQEKEAHQEEIAEEEAEAEEATADAEPAEPSPPGGEQQPEGGAPPGAPTPPQNEPASLAVSSPEDGSLVFDPDALDAEPGPVIIVYDNPSPVPHNINLEASDGETVAESDDVTAGEVEVSAELAPGDYIFFCSIPGHRESGMEGDLIIGRPGSS